MDDVATSVVRRIVELVQHRRADLVQQNRPLVLVLLMGSIDALAGQVAQAVAESAFGGSAAVLHFDMAQYKQRFQLADFVGAPPAFIGYGPPGRLTESVRLNPNQVVLLERLEQAHSDVQNILLNIAEHGTLSDHVGRTVDFRGAIIILTTEAGVSPQQAIRQELLALLDNVIDLSSAFARSVEM